jgi:hypothetical protein
VFDQRFYAPVDHRQGSITDPRELARRSGFAFGSDEDPTGVVTTEHVEERFGLPLLAHRIP